MSQPLYLWCVPLYTVCTANDTQSFYPTTLIPHHPVKQPVIHNLSTLEMYPTTLWNSQGHTIFDNYVPHCAVKQPGTHNLSTLGMHPTTLWNSQGHTTFLPWVCTPLHCETARDMQPFYLWYVPHYTVKQLGTRNLSSICTPLHCETARDMQPFYLRYVPHYNLKHSWTHNLWIW